MNVTPLLNGLARLLTRRGAGFREQSDRSWPIAPGEATNTPPALFHRSELGRVTGVQDRTTLHNELRRIHGGEFHHAPCVAYRLRDVVLLDGHFYQGTMKHRLTNRRGQLADLGRPDRFGAATLACSLYGNIYFGHFMRDDLTLQLAANGLPDPVTIDRPPYAHEVDYRRALGLPARALRHAHFSELIVVDDVGQNRYERERYQTLRERLRTSRSREPPATGSICVAGALASGAG